MLKHWLFTAPVLPPVIQVNKARRPFVPKNPRMPTFTEDFTSERRSREHIPGNYYVLIIYNHTPMQSHVMPRHNTEKSPSASTSTPRSAALSQSPSPPSSPTSSPAHAPQAFHTTLDDDGADLEYLDASMKSIVYDDDGRAWAWRDCFCEHIDCSGRALREVIKFVDDEGFALSGFDLSSGQKGGQIDDSIEQLTGESVAKLDTI
ncbi:hypothetical protein BU24DRAFT_27598 [Aaosphaeria arxii CBS 175.79]|uniref:Uncharacterized protein n=1 Tax=Aaosphaeria arxii CBS 175.79 TaxID=1450172 RepID=A0A6A5Y8M1_9PLEO|nr:uncharacterized protein BU24DRAFT_27598 [Aaosphaeria arxii CBS 175.79]KAF2021748.1 hypothetical protein BU24DRAFT_27598 [Aaosphaeria arxii CBS 175.79]